MGLSVLKWVYELGVKHERNRIAAYLRHSQPLRDPYEIERRVLGANPQLTPTEAKRRAQWQYEVDMGVNSIIDGLFNAEEKYVRGESVMFPRGEE